MYETNDVTALIAALHKDIVSGIADITGRPRRMNDDTTNAFLAYEHILNMRERERELAQANQLAELNERTMDQPTNFKGYYISSLVSRLAAEGDRFGAEEQLYNDMHDSGNGCMMGGHTIRNIIADYCASKFPK